MDFRKLLTIALKDVRVLFSDRNLMMLMFVAPIALTAIIAGALGGFYSNDGGGSPIQNIPIAIVNEDAGTIFLQAPSSGQAVTSTNFGHAIAEILLPGKNTQLNKLIAAQEMTRDEAIKQVNEGKLTAAIIIPRDFSRSLNPLLNQKIQPTEIQIYRDAGAPIAGSVVASVVRGIVNNFSANFITFYAARDAGVALTETGGLTDAINAELQKLPVQLAPVTVTGEKVETQGFNALQYFAPAMAIFFVMFTAAGMAGSILDEQVKWTLQRMSISPTPRSTILAGKLGGTYLGSFTQLAILIVAMAILGVVMGQKASVWGTNPLAVLLVTIVTVLAACGLGIMVGGLARSATQADTLSTLVVTFSGMLGGAFFPLASLGGPFELLSKLTINYWGTNAYSELARTSNLSAVLPNIAALCVMFLVYFSIGVFAFNRRLKG
jgi:ABC-2 type transport system permease protein